MWRQFDAGEVREDFARIAGLGLDTVRFFLRWDDFAPTPDAVDPVMLDRLEAVAGLAAEAGLQTVPTLFCGHMEGTNWLPAWAVDAKRSRGRFRTIAGGAESPFGCGDIYAGPLLDAQLVFARAAGVRLRAHPGVKAWDIGHAFSNVRQPSHAKIATGDHGAASAAEPVVARWSRRLTDALLETSSIPVTAGTHSADLTQERDIRLGSLCAPFAFASMQGSSVTSAFARSRLDPEAVPFLAMLAAGLAHKPVLFTSFGNPTCPADKFSAFEHFPAEGEIPDLVISPDDTAFATYPCLSEAENAAYCTHVLERLHADGRLGAFWWCWSDYAEELRAQPPFDRAPHAMSCGIVRGDGSEKPVAEALASFARRAETVLEPHDMPMISDTYYYRTLPKSTQTLYDAFLGFVSERRAATKKPTPS